MVRRIGLVAGWEPTFTEELIARCNARAGLEAAMAVIGGTPERLVSRYDVLVDRFSHLVPHYRCYLKAAVLAGTTVINDPFPAGGDDRLFAASLAARLGLNVPRAVLLPQKAYGAQVATERCLGNLQYPVDWHGITQYVRFPALLRPVTGGGQTILVRDLGGLMGAFDSSGEQVMMLQEHIKTDVYLRCIVVGHDHAMAVQYDPLRKCHVYHDHDRWLPAAVHDQALADSLGIARALGFELCAVEIGVSDAVAYVVDACNPVPDLHRESLGARYFDTVLGWLTDVVERAARATERTADRQPWAKHVAARG